MGKAERRGEPAIAEATFRKLGLPVAGRIESEAWWKAATWSGSMTERSPSATTYRTNEEGIRQLAKLVGPDVESSSPICALSRTGRCVPLMSVLSPIDLRSGAGLFAADANPFSRLADPARHQAGRGAGERVRQHGCNVLAIAPRRCLMLQGNPKDGALLRAAGARSSRSPAAIFPKRARAGRPADATHPAR